MNIVVCPLSKVQQMVEAHHPERVVSLLDPGFEFPALESSYRDLHLRLHFHDVLNCAAGQVPPTAAHVNQLLEFISPWARSGPLLIHCLAGISRSSAAAFIAACFHNPEIPEIDIAWALRRASAHVRPNELLIQLADTAMGRRGRLVAAIQESGRNLLWKAVDENLPFELIVHHVISTQSAVSQATNALQSTREGHS